MIPRPPHFHCNMTRFLKHHLPGKWIGKGGPTLWSPRSLDLTPLDFILGWGGICYGKYLHTSPKVSKSP